MYMEFKGHHSKGIRHQVVAPLVLKSVLLTLLFIPAFDHGKDIHIPRIYNLGQVFASKWVYALKKHMVVLGRSIVYVYIYLICWGVFGGYLKCI